METNVKVSRITPPPTKVEDKICIELTLDQARLLKNFISLTNGSSIADANRKSRNPIPNITSLTAGEFLYSLFANLDGVTR